MFLNGINLALLSICFITSNNEIRDSGNLISATFNQQYGVYVVEFMGEFDIPYVLRYDNQSVLYFSTTYFGNSQTDVEYSISYNERSNLDVWVILEDDNFNNFPTDTSSFDTLLAPSNPNQSVYPFTYQYDATQSGGYASDSYPHWTLSIRTLSREIYDMSDDYQEGYNTGYNDGYNSGNQDGTQEGYDTGYDDGYDSGYNTGKTDGYNQGYNTALNTHDFSFTNLFASISDTPILFLRRMFNFGIFGVSAISILFSLFTCLIFIKIIKRFI